MLSIVAAIKDKLSNEFSSVHAKKSFCNVRPLVL